MNSSSQINVASSPHLNTEPENQLSCATMVWENMKNVLSEGAENCKAFMKKIGELLASIARYLWRALAWVGNNVFRNTFMTGVNILGYIIEKFLYGSPGLRPHLHDGIFPSDISDSWRTFVRENTGWDIYETMHPAFNNLFGVLGGGIGILNFFNHLLTSVCNNISNNLFVLGKYGCAGETVKTEDKRNAAVKTIFGILSLPIVVPSILITNIFDIIMKFTFEFCRSVQINSLRTYHMLGEHGVMGSRIKYSDDRSKLTQIFYGILSAPLVTAISSISNIIDVSVTTLKHFFTSLNCNFKKSFNFLGEHGVMGKRRTCEDDRKLSTKIIFGILSSPFVAAASLLTNLLDGTLTFSKHFVLSLYHNIRSSFNFLGKKGVMGEQRAYQDKRNLSTRVFFGILSSPLVVVSSAVTNLVDLVCLTTKHLGLSFIRNLKPICNILGKDGFFGERFSYKDDRALGVKLLFGLITAPLVGAAAVATNLIDLSISFCRNFLSSLEHNVRKTFNFLGKNGVMGERRTFNDPRGLPAKIIFGVVSAPVTAAISTFTNLLDVSLTLAKHLFLSIKYNVKKTFNFLGEYGVMGERKSYDDKRGLATKVIFGVLTSPVTIAISLATNFLDGSLTFANNLMRSFSRNLSCVFNLLGEKGVMGKRHDYADNRSMATKILCGILTAPFVATAALVTNTIDLVGAYFKNYKQTIKEPAMIIGGGAAAIALSVPVFIMRKTLKGLYDCTLGPLTKLFNGEHNSALKILKGCANFLTLGLSSVILKIVKASTGYSHRFGSENHHPSPENPEIKNCFDEVQDKFKQAIKLAKHGNFPNVKDFQGHFRPVTRLFYGFRHTIEKVLKKFHDAYLDYANSLKKDKVDKTNKDYNMQRFFKSPQYFNTESKIKLRKGEENIIEEAHNYLLSN